MYPVLAMLLLIALMASPAGAEPGDSITRTAGGQLIAAPVSASKQPDWLVRLKQWRSSIVLDRSRYDSPRFAWTRHSFVQALVIAQERTLYDPVKRKYTVERYLDDVERRYGGIDSVIIWHTYPNIGIDDRSQHDHLRDMPGGLPGLRKMVDDFHKHGVRVLFPIMPWDRGTVDEGISLAEATVRDMAAIGADGVFGDTLNGIDESFRMAADKAGLPLVLEPELNVGADGMLAGNTMSWGQFWDEPFEPGISAYKWLEPRHMVHVVNRWSKDRTGDLQRAFLNGTGYESWENVWGLWNGIAPKDAANLRRISAIQREFAEVLASTDWEPYTPTQADGVFASRFTAGKQALWTLINRNDQPASAAVLPVTDTPETRYYDLWNGKRITPKCDGDVASLPVRIESYGFGAVLAVNGSAPRTLERFLKRMAAMPATPASSEWKVLPQRQTPIAPTRAMSTAPEGMIRIPGAAFEFKVSGVEIEGSDEFGIDVQYPWEDAPILTHSRIIDVAPFYIDRTPVTNAQFKQFLDATKYRPKDSHNFLRDWVKGAYPKGWRDRAVTWVSLEDARAYANWAGKRLPHEWEWQYAAQGTDSRSYPWGSEPNTAAIPAIDTGRTMAPPAGVLDHPAGASPFGVLDLVGNVWEWTDEYADEHTRFAILRGGSHFKPLGSDWYFPQALRLDQHGKYLLMSPGKDRSGAIGFRCVVDASG